MRSITFTRTPILPLLIGIPISFSTSAGVQGDFKSGGSGGGAMDIEYVNNYPYSRCSQENIPSEDCKEFGYVFGEEPITFKQFIDLVMNTSPEQYRADMVSDNYNVPDNFHWLLPTEENLRYAKSQGMLHGDNLYPVFVDDGNKDEYLTEREIQLVHLPGANLPDTINDDTEVVGLLAAYALDSDGNIIPGTPGEPGSPGKIDPDKGEIIILDPHEPEEPPGPTPPPGAVLGQICGEQLNDMSPSTPSLACLKVNELDDGSYHTQGITTYWAEKWLPTVPYTTEGDYAETAFFSWDNLDRVCSTLNQMNFLNRTNWQLPTDGQIFHSIAPSYENYELPDRYNWRYQRDGFEDMPSRESGVISYAGEKFWYSGVQATVPIGYGKVERKSLFYYADQISWPVSCYSQSETADIPW